MEARQRRTPVDADMDHRRLSQIKSRDRVRDLAEVYTHEREVNAMLDLVPDMFPSERDPGNTDRTFLEPACGHGNFLVEILRRKLEHVTPRRYGRGERFEHRILRCLASIYGIDICEENVARVARADASRNQRTSRKAPESRCLRREVSTRPSRRSSRPMSSAPTRSPTPPRSSWSNTEPGSGGTFIREWSRPLDPAVGEPNLFSLPPRCDEVPVHYSELARQTEPTVADPAQRKAA